MSDYAVTVKRWDRGWELHIDGVGVTQARNLREADAMVRDYLEIMEGEEAAASAKLNYTYALPAVARFEKAKKATSEAERLTAQAAAESRSAVAQLMASGVSGADMSKLLALSPQRVSQLVAAARALATGAPVGRTAAKASAKKSTAKKSTAKNRAAAGKTLKAASKSRSASTTSKSLTRGSAKV
jgi:hypothetical protein